MKGMDNRPMTNQTVAHVKYEQHVKKSLQSGKPVQYSMKDFLPNNSSTAKSRHNSAADPVRQSILRMIKHNQNEYAGVHNIFLRGSLLDSFVMKMMYEANTIEEARKIYDIYRSIIYDAPI